MIEITNKDSAFKGVYWVLSAREVKSDRGLDNIKVEAIKGKAKFIGCDGYRLHIFKTIAIEVPEGIYAVVKFTKTKIVLILAESDATYPNFNLVIPRPDSVYKSAEFNGSSNMASNMASIMASINFKYLANALPDNIALDYELFKQFTDINKGDFKIMLSQRKQTKAEIESGEMSDEPKILLKKQGFFGILMPIRADNEPTWGEK